MDSKAMNRKSWIKNITIIFLAVMLFLTFFSQTIMNYSLPEVSAQYPTSGSITTRVRKTGVVAAAEDYEVILDETRNILGVEVKKGDTVAIGDLLFTLEEGDSKEVENAQKAYENAKVSYDQKLLTFNMDYTDETNTISEASTELVKLKNKKNNSGEDLIKQLNKEKADLEWEKSILSKQNPNVKYEYSIVGKSNSSILSDANNLYTQSQSDYEKSKTDLDNAETAMKTAERNQTDTKKTLTQAEKALEDYKKEIGSTTDVTNETILAAKRKIEDYERLLRNYNEDLSKANKDWQNAVSTANNTLINAFKEYTDAQEKLAKDEIDQAAFDAIEKIYTEASTNFNIIQSTKPTAVTSVEQSIEAQEITLRNAREDLRRDEAKLNENSDSNDQIKKYEKIVSDAQTDSDNATEKYNDAKKNFEDTATKNKDDAEKLMNGYLSLKLDTEVKIIEEKIRDIEYQITDIGTPVTDQQIEDAEKKLKSAQEAFDKKKREFEKTHESELLQLDVDQKNLERLLAEVERLQKNNVGTEVRAKIAGMISEINFVAGNEVKAGDRLAKIQVVQKGYYVEFDVTNEEAARIRPGEIASVQYYWGSTIEAVVESIKNSSSNPGKARTVRISIAGEIDVGRQLTFNLGERGQNYDTVVPKSAIREDSNGKFILTVVSKSTPLGNRYNAVRVDVTVLEEDDTNCAINLGLYGSEFIITTSTKPIKDGDQVRLVDR